MSSVHTPISLPSSLPVLVLSSSSHKLCSGLDHSLWDSAVFTSIGESQCDFGGVGSLSYKSVPPTHSPSNGPSGLRKIWGTSALNLVHTESKNFGLGVGGARRGACAWRKDPEERNLGELDPDKSPYSISTLSPANRSKEHSAPWPRP